MSNDNNGVHTYDGIREDREQKPPFYFTLLFYGLIIWGVFFSAYFLLSGWNSHDEFEAKMQMNQQKATESLAAPASMNK